MIAGDRDWVSSTSSFAAGAFEEVYERHVKSVYRYAFHILRRNADAEDITQEVFVLAWRKRTRIQLADVSLLPWLLVCSRNLSLNRLRELERRSRQNVVFADDRSTGSYYLTAAEMAENRMLHQAIDDAIKALSLPDQALYHLCITEGLSYQRAAVRLGVTHGTVRNRLARLRQSLRITLTSQREGLS